jgi:hypothetical protein
MKKITFVDCFENQVVEGNLSLDEFLEDTAQTIGDLLEYASPELFESRLHLFISHMYDGRLYRRTEATEPPLGGDDEQKD